MSSVSGVWRKAVFSLLLAAMAGALITPAELLAQNESDVPKYDLFLGYQWLHPGGNVPSRFSNTTTPTAFQVPDMPNGFGITLGYNFDKNWALEADLGHNWDHYETTVSVGPRLMFRTEDGDYFIHALISYNRLGIDGLDASNGIGGIAGGGMDWKITRKLSWRVFEADWVGATQHYPQFFPSSLARPGLSGARLRTGLVFNMGFPEGKPVSVGLVLQPEEVMVGEGVTASATPENFNPKHTLTYNWTSTCGRITGHDATASIDTNGVPGGSCTVTVQVVDPKDKKKAQAQASKNYLVREPPKNPPAISCSASPASVQAGATVAVTCTCTSPDHVPVTVGNYTASAGTISDSGNTATLNTTGVAPGTITVNASCRDQRGLNTPATTEVTVEAPPPPPQVSPEVRRLEQRLALHSVYFPTAQPTVKNPNGGLVKSQQGTLTALADDFKKYLESKPDAHLILEGHADPRGSAEYNQALSERRVQSTKNFLVQHGVPEANIETKAFGAQQQLSSDQVKQSLDQDTELTAGEKQRITRNMRTIILASNRRVDVTLNTTGQESVRQFPFNAEDALTLIGGREKPAAAPAKKAVKKKPTKR